MPSLYVAGPSPTQRVSPDERRQINEVYHAIADWSSVHDVMFSIPSDQPAWLRMPTTGIFVAGATPN
jgi:hypothetical protein